MSNLPRIIDTILFCPHCGVQHVDEARRLRADHIPEWFIEPLEKLQQAAFDNIKESPLFTTPAAIRQTYVSGELDITITVPAEFGLRVSLFPGSSLRVVGPHGYIHIKSEAAK